MAQQAELEISAAAAREALKGGHPDQALALALRGMKKAPSDRRYLLVAADACGKLGRHDDRVRYLRTMALLQPDDVRNWARLATAIGIAEGPERSAEEIRGIHEKRPSEALRGLLSDLYRKALQFDAALALWPDDQDTRHLRNKADILLECRRYAEAEAVYSTVLASAPDDVEALKGLARVSQHTGDWPKAIQRWQAATDGAPGDPAPRMHLASVLRMNGDTPDAEQTIQEAMQLCETAQPLRFWGRSGEPHPNATARPLSQRSEEALADQARHLVLPGSRYHPSSPSPFDQALDREWAGQSSNVLQYPGEAKFLTLFLAEHGIRSFFEVGMRHGAFTQLLDRMLKFDRVGGSEFIVTPKLRELMKDPRYRIFAGDHHGADYRTWREAQEPYDFVFIDGGHSYNDVMRDYIRESAFRPRFIGFHDVWNIACLGAKRMWDELPGKVAYYCNTDPAQYLFIANRDRNFETSYLNTQRESNGYCCGIGIIEVGNQADARL